MVITHLGEGGEKSYVCLGPWETDDQIVLGTYGGARV